METKKMVDELKNIEMSQEMRERIIRNCCREMEDVIMNKNTRNNFWKKPMTVATSFALCLCLTGITALAATGKLEGYFKDIKGWDGAVIGTSYEQATDEIELAVENVSDELVLEVTMVNPKTVPYSTLELFGIESYKIVDMAGNVVVEGEATEMAEITEGKVKVSISMDSVPDGVYKLIVSKFVGSAKAEQPLTMSGVWECEFTK